MANFGEIIDKFLAVLLAILEALSPDLIAENINAVDNSFAEYGNVQMTRTSPRTTTPAVPPAALLNVSKFPDFSNDTCQSDFCSSYAASVISTLSPETDPCDGFYEFACGQLHGPLAATPGSPRNVPGGVIALLRNRTLTRIKGLLESNAPSDSEAVSKARRIYQACVAHDDADTTSVDSLKSTLNEVIGGWPLTTPGWNASEFDLYRTLASAKILGFDLVFQWSIATNPKNPTRNVIQLGQAILGLESPNFYGDDSAAIRSAYRDLINHVASLLAGDNSTDLTLPIRDLIDFEKTLANETVPQIGSPVTTLISINTFAHQYELTTRLGKELQNVFKTVLNTVDLDSVVSGSSVINVENPEFFSRLGIQLEELERLDDDGKTILANYIGWNIIFTQLPLLPAGYRNLLQSFTRASGVTIDLPEGLPRWQGCVEFVNGMMGSAVGSLYVKRFILPETKEKVQTIINAVKSSALEYVNQTSWLDTPAKSAASDKISTITDFTGYAEYIADNGTLVNAYYDELNVSDNHFDNVQNLHQFTTKQELRRLAQPSDLNVDNDPTIPVAVNAFYYYDQNLIALFAGLLQPPFFDMEAPDYVNYAGIGYLYAYELTFAFGEYGSKFNGSGFLTAGWSDQTSVAYKALTNQLQSQYKNFRPGTTAEPSMNAAPLLADSLAIQLALAAYRANHVTREPALPNLTQFSPDMQLLLSFAQNWCETTDATTANSAAISNPKNLLVDIPLINLPEFSSIYKCDAGSRMETQQKVSLL